MNHFPRIEFESDHSTSATVAGSFLKQFIDVSLQHDADYSVIETLIFLKFKVGLFNISCRTVL